MRVSSVDFGEMKPARVQHVWVDVTGRWTDPSPGLLMMWRQRRGKRPGWDGWVIYASVPKVNIIGVEPEPVLQQGWVDSRLIRPRPSELPKPDRSGYRPIAETIRNEAAGGEAPA